MTSAEPRTPPREPVLALREQLPHETPQRLRDGAVRDVPDDLIELAGDEVAALPDDGPVQLVDERGLPDSGVPRDQHERRAACAGLLERLQQVVDLPFTAIEPL
jgi:hypothetical protein